MLAAPRCLVPMRAYDRAGEIPELTRVCWRPAGHPGRRHASRAAYLRTLLARQGASRGSHHARREQPGMSAAGGKPG
jgi:hypothetical protein